VPKTPLKYTEWMNKGSTYQTNLPLTLTLPPFARKSAIRARERRPDYDNPVATPVLQSVLARLWHRSRSSSGETMR
jgi:hypothetical protein